MNHRVVYVLLAAAACGGGGGGGDDDDDSPPIDAPPSFDASVAPYCTPTSSDGLTLTLVAEGLSQPVLVTAPAGDPRAFVVEQIGRIRFVDAGGLRPTAFLDIQTRIDAAASERGLLGLAFHPHYRDNGRFFVSYSRASDGARVIAEYHAEPTADVAETTERVLITDPHPRENHNGGSIEFGPDGYLYIAFGDGGGRDDNQDGGQNPDTKRGKILRIDVDSGDPYGIPTDNPWADGVGGVPEMFAWGLRNPWRMSFDAQGNLFIGDVGQDTYEEVDVIPAGTGGQNFGWPVFEGPMCFTADSNGALDCDHPDDYVAPLYAYNRVGTGQCSVMGGYVYRGRCLPDLAGTYFFGDYCTGEIDSLRYVGGVATDVADRTDDLDPGGLLTGRLTSFGTDGYAELYVTASNGRIYRFAAE